MRRYRKAVLVVGTLCAWSAPGGAVTTTKGGPDVSAVTPLTDPTDWIRTDDYPAKALNDGVEGFTKIMLTVDAAGFVSDCAVTISSGSPLLDQTTCGLLTARARFRPSAPGAGVSHWTRQVHWKIPKPLAIDLRPVAFSIQYDVGEDGTPSACLVQGTPPGVSPEQVCTDLVRGTSFKPALDRDGRPVRRRVIQTFSVQVAELPGAPVAPAKTVK